MRFGENCFLSSPEWLALLTGNSTWPYQALQRRSLTLRTQLHLILLDLPILISQSVARYESHVRHADWARDLDTLIHRASTTFVGVQKWLTLAPKPVPYSLAPTHNTLPDYVKYLDILAAVSDCVANTALLAIDKILRFLHHARQSSPSLVAWQDVPQVQTDNTSADPTTVEGWHQRAVSAFGFVRGESLIAAKPLDFGLREVESGISGYSFD